MPQILVGKDAEQTATAGKTAGELEIREIAAPVHAAQPVLLLGEVVMADAGAMQPPQYGLGGTEIGAVALRLGDMQRHAVDPAAHQLLASAEQQRWRDLQRAGPLERAALARE